MVTIYDIAERAGCSAMTVSRVINNTGRISEKTRQRVKAIMAEMNYVPNIAARSLVLQETKLLSLVIPDITNPFYTTLARGAEDAARKFGYQLLFSNSDENLEKENATLDAVISARADGVLIAPVGDGSAPCLEQLKQHNIPVVLLDREVPGFEADTVLGDSKEGAKALTAMLLAQGHRRIAFINGSLSTSTARQRLLGYREGLSSAGIACDDAIVFEAGFADTGLAEIIGKLMDLEQRPTAVFAANNKIALAAIRSLHAAGLSIPRDMSVVCFDDLEADYVVDPFLTVAAQPAYEFGAVGVGLLVERIKDRSRQPRTVTLSSALMKRRSTAPLR
ncbi:LacI family DNA-binding transcriptional regulator [Paenibacillus thailandensis]|uniref:LacI family DNA-binding transcriptional regulator n=1 Tax=Paenibacillus thailandensis TaxID=393250 RepID=A0ABW5QV54_9BACL